MTISHALMPEITNPDCKGWRTGLFQVLSDSDNLINSL